MGYEKLIYGIILTVFIAFAAVFLILIFRDEKIPPSSSPSTTTTLISTPSGGIDIVRPLDFAQRLEKIKEDMSVISGLPTGGEATSGINISFQGVLPPTNVDLAFWTQYSDESRIKIDACGWGVSGDSLNVTYYINKAFYDTSGDKEDLKRRYNEDLIACIWAALGGDLIRPSEYEKDLIDYLKSDDFEGGMLIEDIN